MAPTHPLSVAPASENTPTPTPPQTNEQTATIQPADIWERFRAGFRLEPTDHSQVEREIQRYLAHPDYLHRVQQRARPFLFFILEEIQQRGLPTELALLPVVESAFQPFAYSPEHAAGIWQFIPATGRHYGLKQGWWYDGRRDITTSTRAALDYLQRLGRRFYDDWELALAAYNAGEGFISKALRNNRRQGKATDYWSLKLPRETRIYVPRLLALRKIIAEPERYGIDLEPIPDEPYLLSVDIDSQLDLTVAAELAQIPVEEIYRLNPGFSRWATDPDGPHRLLLPRDKAQGFRHRLQQLKPEQRMRWTRYRIRNGDSLSVIAQRHGTTVTRLKKVNRLRSSRIRAGRHLLIPSSLSRVAGLPTNGVKAEAAQSTPLSYTVRPGDTLWDISRAYRVSYRKLAKWNGLALNTTLQPKQKLLIWKQVRD